MGERLLARVYSAIRACSTAAGSNFANTLFLVAFDEHEGTYDHVRRHESPARPGRPGRTDDSLRRSGIRIPLAISAYIDPRTVVTGDTATPP